MAISDYLTYASMMKNPFDNLTEGFNTGFKIGDAQLKQQQAINQQQQAAEQQRHLKSALPIYAAMRNNRTDIAETLLNQRIAASENAGDMQGAQNMRNVLELIKADPASARDSIGSTIANIMGPKEYDQMIGAMGKDSREQELQPHVLAKTQGEADKLAGEESRATALQPYAIQKVQADIGKTKADTEKSAAEAAGTAIENKYKPQVIQEQITSSIAARQNEVARRDFDYTKLAQDAQIQLETMRQNGLKLGDSQQKFITDTIVGAGVSQQDANKAEGLAKQLQEAGGGYGVFSTANEWLRNKTGNQNEMSALRTQYNQVRMSGAIKMLPPGPATDRDIQLALKGFPSETADSKTLAAFLRGTAKLNRIDATHKEMQAEWMNQTGGLGSTKRDAMINGVQVPKGTTFNSFYANNISAQLKQNAAREVQNQVATGQRGYMKYAQE